MQNKIIYKGIEIIESKVRRLQLGIELREIRKLEYSFKSDQIRIVCTFCCRLSKDLVDVDDSIVIYWNNICLTCLLKFENVSR